MADVVLSLLSCICPLPEHGCNELVPRDGTELGGLFPFRGDCFPPFPQKLYYRNLCCRVLRERERRSLDFA